VFLVNMALAALACMSVWFPTWPAGAACLLAAAALVGWLLLSLVRGKP
jgi:hypothetical protein